MSLVTLQACACMQGSSSTDRCLGGLMDGRLDRSHHALAALTLLSALALINRAIENRWREVLMSPNSALIR